MIIAYTVLALSWLELLKYSRHAMAIDQILRTDSGHLILLEFHLIAVLPERAEGGVERKLLSHW